MYTFFAINFLNKINQKHVSHILNIKTRVREKAVNVDRACELHNEKRKVNCSVLLVPCSIEINVRDKHNDQISKAL